MNDIKVPPFTDGQKQLIEMTEKLAEKRGGKICDVDGIDDDIKDVKELLNDTIKRIEEPTNEDWLRSLNTEQLAEWLAFLVYDVICKNGGRSVAEEDTEYWLEWLKEIHKE